MVFSKFFNSSRRAHHTPDSKKKSGPKIFDKKVLFFYVVRIFLIYCIVSVVPILFVHVLHGGIPLYIILGLLLFKLVPETIQLTGAHRIVKFLCASASFIYSILFAFVLVICIIITPHSVYAFFFEMVRDTGILTQEFFTGNLFILLSIFFSQFFGAASLKTNSFKPLVGLIWLFCGLFLIMYQSLFFALLLGISLFVYLLVLLKKRVFYFTAIIIPAIVVSSLLFIVQPHPGGSSFVDEFFFPKTRAFIDTYFPQFPLLVDIPGYGVNSSTSRLGEVQSSPLLRFLNCQQRKRE